ncbi:hypothetical protein [Oceanobacter antarcticus]|uniref:Uncharacterized protein n=1 Tax=Oceanobacter antarcticus TaxID=3133425 RepID=A0ABW8NNH4_9GAMM
MTPNNGNLVCYTSEADNHSNGVLVIENKYGFSPELDITDIIPSTLQQHRDALNIIII